jgi:hypothetical protein
MVSREHNEQMDIFDGFPVIAPPGKKFIAPIFKQKDVSTNSAAFQQHKMSASWPI